MARALDQTLALDDAHDAAYILTGAALAGHTVDVPWALGVLAQGARALPRDWQVQLLYGFHAYEQEIDAKGSAAALARAAALPGAPPFLAYVAARASAQAHDPRIGLSMLDALMRTTTDPEQQQHYAERKRWLYLELALEEAQRAVAAYCAQHPAPPGDWHALVAAKLIPRVPEDPTGGLLVLDGCQAVRSAHEAQRLSRRPTPHNETL